MKRLSLTFILNLSFLLNSLFAKEGMWIPMLISQINEADMRNMGLKISADEIYSINHSSIKDAIVLFGGGCTAEIISEKGLILTNHHCGISIVQSYSTLDHDYLNNGFWALRNEEELPAKGLTATIMIRMEDVSDKVLQNLDDHLSQAQRNAIIKSRCEKIEKEAVKGSSYKAKVKPFYYGNKYYLIVDEVFEDVRLVGAPPVSIGKFGGDTDNWMWPRHTGDFCLFRIYTDKNNKPAPYSKENIPYKPKYSLTLSTKGIKNDDFTFVYGYPGRTQEYIPSFGVEMITEIENPVRISLRNKRLHIIEAAMQTNYLSRLQYTAKSASIANYWKKMIGESRGTDKLKTITNKKQFEAKFADWVKLEAGRNHQYGSLLNAYDHIYKQLVPLNLANDYFSEAALGTDYIRIVNNLDDLINLCKDKASSDSVIIKEGKKQLIALTNFHKNTSSVIEINLFRTMIREYYNNRDISSHPDVFDIINTTYHGKIDRYLDDVISKSVFISDQKISKLLSNFKRKNYKIILKDPLFTLAESIYKFYYSSILPQINILNYQIDSLNRLYMKAQLEMDTERTFYPDANLTLRISYGKIEGYKPEDAISYLYFTTLKGIIEKEDTSIFDYKVNERLKDLYLKKDYGPYSDADGEMHVCFIASNHTTGGNSGSPVLNAEGQLIGLNFDRVWEGTMSDLNFNTDYCRNISLDIRYFLFIVDKFAGAKNLLSEMKIQN